MVRSVRWDETEMLLPTLSCVPGLPLRLTCSTAQGEEVGPPLSERLCLSQSTATRVVDEGRLPFCCSVTSLLAEYETYPINCEKTSSYVTFSCVCHLVKWCWKWISVLEKPFQSNSTGFQYATLKLYVLNVKYFTE